MAMRRTNIRAGKRETRRSIAAVKAGENLFNRFSLIVVLSVFVCPGVELTVIGMRLSENALETAVVSGRTRVRRSRAIPPVRFVHPRSASGSALVFSSALGGGMLEGDDYRFDLECRENSTLMFAPQANTRIFPCPGGAMTRQTVRGTVYAGGLAVCGGDPIVPYVGSRFTQSQSWVLHPGSRLVMVDWMIAGRLDRGEDFAFSSYESEMRVEDPDGRPLLSDTLRLDTGGMKADVQRGMGGFSSLLNVHVLGPGWENLHDPVEAWLRIAGGNGRPRWMDGTRQAGLGIREGRGFSLRALGRNRAALEPLAVLLFGEIARPEWLGFDVWGRKY
jgi:urease accessory protein